MGDFDWSAIWYGVPYMLQGTLITLEISACAMILASITGLAMGLISASTLRVPKAISRAYVYFVRGTPALVQIFLVYFAMPRLGFEFSPFWSGVVALAFNSAGFIAEIMRAGLQSIDAGQTEAALAIGMTERQSITFILLPQSLRRVTRAQGRFVEQAVSDHLGIDCSPSSNGKAEGRAVSTASS